jgi:riboflavin synthase
VYIKHMFTGIIEEQGIIRNIEKRRTLWRLSIKTKLGKNLNSGDSIAIDGACLTVVERKSDLVTVEAIRQTLEITTLKDFKIGREVNVETSLTLSKPMSGHLVQGHIDSTGTVNAIKRNADYLILELEISPDVMNYVVPKGSIAVNGVSLTIAEVHDFSVTINIIPHTAEITNLGGLKTGNKVNIEFDIIGKYIYTFIQKLQKDSVGSDNNAKIIKFLLPYETS